MWRNMCQIHRWTDSVGRIGGRTSMSICSMHLCVCPLYSCIRIMFLTHIFCSLSFFLSLKKIYMNGNNLQYIPLSLCLLPSLEVRPHRVLCLVYFVYCPHFNVYIFLYCTLGAKCGQQPHLVSAWGLCPCMVFPGLDHVAKEWWGNFRWRVEIDFAWESLYGRSFQDLNSRDDCWYGY